MTLIRKPIVLNEMMSRNSKKLLTEKSSFKSISNDSTCSTSVGNGNCHMQESANDSRKATENNYFIRNLMLSDFWFQDKTNSIYENLCQGCGYGIFEAEGKLCDFCRLTIAGCFKETNIYENICDNCGDIYSGNECVLCSNRINEEQKLKRINFKPNRILSGIFGTLKKARSREKSSTKYRKLEIVHNVDGYDNVFKTNKTFNLNEICELKHLYSNSDHHIYGKLRKSDDHLINSIKFEHVNLIVNSKSEPNLQGGVKKKFKFKNKFSSDKSSCALLQDDVIEWMASLRRQTVDYGQLLSDDSIFNTKSIPSSRNFSCCRNLNECGSLSKDYKSDGADIKLLLLSNDYDEIKLHYNNDLVKFILKNHINIEVNGVKLNNVIVNLVLSKSLNKVVLSYDKHLSEFLHVVNRHFTNYKFSKLLCMYNKLFSLHVNRKINNSNNSYHETTTSLSLHENSLEITPTLDEDNIYQPIWQFQTIGKPHESYVSDYYDLTINDSSSKIVEDHGEWETDDEFMFSKKMKEPTIDIGTPKTTQSETSSYNKSVTSLYDDTNKESVVDHYKTVCILYSLTEIKLRAIIYSYDSKRLYFTNQSHINKNSRIITTTSLPRVQPLGNSYNINKIKRKSRVNIAIEQCIHNCVQEWKCMLLDVNYLDDEEDVYVSENELQKLRKIENEIIPVCTLQRFKSISTGNLLDIPQDKKKSIGERVRNKLQMGVLKLNNRSPKEKKEKHIFKRLDYAGPYLNENSQPKAKYPIFGSNLDEVEKHIDNSNVPRFVIDCITIIERKENIQSEGLYRASANKIEIDQIKKKLSNRYVYDSSLLRNEDVHILTGLLKLFFRELQTPLIAANVYQKLPENLVDKANLLLIKEVLCEIENPYRETLKFLLKLLTKVALHSATNRMPASNLAIIWGPCILYASSSGPFDIARMNMLTKVLIENYDVIFFEDERLIH